MGAIGLLLFEGFVDLDLQGRIGKAVLFPPRRSKSPISRAAGDSFSSSSLGVPIKAAYSSALASNSARQFSIAKSKSKSSNCWVSMHPTYRHRLGATCAQVQVVVFSNGVFLVEQQ